MEGGVEIVQLFFGEALERRRQQQGGITILFDSKCERTMFSYDHIKKQNAQLHSTRYIVIEDAK